MARTRRQLWVGSIGAGLCACLFPACAQFRGSTSTAKEAREGLGPRSTQAAAAEVKDQLARQDDRATPYHRLPDPPPAPEPGPADVQVRQAIYPPHADQAAPGPDQANPMTAAPAPAPVKPPPEEPLVAALRCFMEKKPAEAVTYLQAYDKQNQELLLCLLPLAARLAGEGIGQAKPRELTTFLEQLQSLEVPLRSRAELVIDKMVFCEEIRKFGVFKPLRQNHHFRAPTGGLPGELVQLYVELRNPSTIVRDEVYETQLASSVQIYRKPGEKAVWSHSFRDRNSRSPSWTLSTDFYKHYSFYVPNILPGNYLLSIRVVDVPTGREVERYLPFVVTKLPEPYE
jgi:hypothetical protein